MLGLPDGARACLFDLDGVLTDTASVHAASWKQMFDDYLRARAERDGTPFRPFDVKDDYGPYVDGRPGLDGTRGFLESRGIELPEGSPDDPPGAETLWGPRPPQERPRQEKIRTVGVDVYPGSVRYLQAREGRGPAHGVRLLVRQRREVLEVAGLSDFIDHRVDGVVAKQRGLPGKPAPDTFLAGRRAISACPGSRPSSSRTRWPGSWPGRAGGFGYVVGVDRVGHADALREHGADVVVQDLAELLRRARTATGTSFAARWNAMSPDRGRLHRRTVARARAEAGHGVIGQVESVFALSNGHIGLRGNLDEGEPHATPGTYLNSFYEKRPLPYAEGGYGYPESGQTIINVTNGKLIRLLVEDEPFDLRYGELRHHERVLDLQAGTLTREVEWALARRARGAGPQRAHGVAHPAGDRRDPLRGRGARRPGAAGGAVRARGQRAAARAEADPRVGGGALSAAAVRGARADDTAPC